MATDMMVAKTILEQLGGRQFIIMTGSKNFVGSADGLSFKVGSNGSKVTHVRITLTPADVYTMEFIRCRGVNFSTVIRHDDVYFDQLQEIFTSVTGMYTRLYTRL